MSNKFQQQLDDLSNMSLDELGSIVNCFGKKHKNIKISEIYKKDPNYILWVKKIKKNNYILNRYFADIEISKRAMTLYYDLMEYLKNQAK